MLKRLAILGLLLIAVTVIGGCHRGSHVHSGHHASYGVIGHDHRGHAHRNHHGHGNRGHNHAPRCRY